MEKMLIMRNWVNEAYESLSKEEFDALAGQILRYGLFGDYNKSNKPVVDVSFSLIAPQISNMQIDYEKKTELGKKGGRPSRLDSKEIWKLAQTKSIKEIAEETGVSASTLYKNEGWRNRDNADFGKF